MTSVSSSLRPAAPRPRSPVGQARPRYCWLSRQRPRRDQRDEPAPADAFRADAWSRRLQPRRAAQVTRGEEGAHGVQVRPTRRRELSQGGPARASAISGTRSQSMLAVADWRSPIGTVSSTWLQMDDLPPWWSASTSRARRLGSLRALETGVQQLARTSRAGARALQRQTHLVWQDGVMKLVLGVNGSRDELQPRVGRRRGLHVPYAPRRIGETMAATARDPTDRRATGAPGRERGSQNLVPPAGIEPATPGVGNARQA
jgi:hypothetical protein